MDKIIVIGDEDTVAGFRLAGVVEATVVDAPEGAEAAVASALDRPDAGILVVTQEVSRWLSAKTRKRTAEAAKPVVVEVPGKRDESSQSESLAALVKKTMGIELKG